jgi:hypothetical protein
MLYLEHLMIFEKTLSCYGDLQETGTKVAACNIVAFRRLLGLVHHDRQSLCWSTLKTQEHQFCKKVCGVLSVLSIISQLYLA